jgi:hypothetical protein
LRSRSDNGSTTLRADDERSYVLTGMLGQGASGAVFRAEEAGLVARESDAEDRRRTWVCATDEGRRRLDRALAMLEEQREPVLEAIERVVDHARAIEPPARRR